MRILADENIPGVAITALQRAGHDVLWVCAETPGADDRTVLAMAARERRLLVTCDKDFGELAFHGPLSAESGVVLCRLMSDSPEMLATRLAAALEAVETWAGRFSVVEDDRIRSTPLPSSDSP